MKKLLIILLLLLLLIYPLFYFSSVEIIEITINDKERITTGSGENISSRFIVYTEDEVFENSDALWFWKFNSTDFQNKLKVGETYEVKVVGWRVPFLSWYRNIVEIK